MRKKVLSEEEQDLKDLKKPALAGSGDSGPGSMEKCKGPETAAYLGDGGGRG